MKDMDIRPILDMRLQKKYQGQRDTAIVHELGVHNGRNRVDIAVVNGILSGYEIKSERDTLARLSMQVKAYGTVFDRMTLVVHERHAEAAQEIVPEWWRIEVVSQPRRAMRFEVLNSGSLNKEVDPYALASLVWRGLSLEILQKRGLDKGLRSASRDRLWCALAQNLPLAELQSEVRTAIRRQQDWLAEQARLQTQQVHQGRI